MYKNITLRLDEAILHKAKYCAVKQDISLSRWVADLIAKTTTKKNKYTVAKTRALKLMEQGFPLGGKPLSREEAHDR